MKKKFNNIPLHQHSEVHEVRLHNLDQSQPIFPFCRTLHPGDHLFFALLIVAIVLARGVLHQPAKSIKSEFVLTKVERKKQNK